MIRNILFDIDDTLLDFGKAEAIALRKTLAELGIEVSDVLISEYSRINAAQWERLERGEVTRDRLLIERFELFFAAEGIDCSATQAQELYEYNLGVGHYFIDGAPELLEALYGKYRLYIVSNGTKCVQDRRIASAGIGKYFENIFISQCIGADKPQREFFDRCFEMIPDLRCEETLILGDRLSSDILGGINAGIKTCLFDPHGCQHSPDIIPDYVIKRLSELPQLLGEMCDLE